MLGENFHKAAARSDNGRSDWDKESEEFLCENYPDWRQPVTTTMIPSKFPLSKTAGSGESAEKKIFDMLEAFGKKYHEPMFVFHSYNFSEQIDVLEREVATGKKKWVLGEHDFVVLTPAIGPIFLQVKAACKTRRQYGEAQAQLDKDKRITAAFLKRVVNGGDKPPKGVADAMFKMPGVVVMPNCKRPENPEQPGLFEEDFADVDAFASWWENNVKFCEGTTGIAPVIYEHLMKRFIGLVYGRRNLSQKIDATQKELNLLTINQLEVLQNGPPHQWIVGAAGTGKTCLLILKVLQLACHILEQGIPMDENKKILVLCFNCPLCKLLKKILYFRLEHLLQGEPLDVIIDVMTYDKFLSECLGASKQHFRNDYTKKTFVAEAFRKIDQLNHCPRCYYEHIFVDEGQDLYGATWPALLQCHLRKKDDLIGLRPEERQHMWVNYDSNQLVQPSAENGRPFLGQQANYNLNKVMRNTVKIFALAEKFFLSQYFQKPTVGHSIDGPDIVWDHSLPEDLKEKNGPILLAEHIRKLEQEGVAKEDITVLAAGEQICDSLARGLIREKIECQNAEDFIENESNAVIIETIRRFKGLESKIVILYDPISNKRHVEADVANKLLYTAITRPSCLLIILGTKIGIALLKNDVTRELLFQKPKVLHGMKRTAQVLSTTNIASARKRL